MDIVGGMRRAVEALLGGPSQQELLDESQAPAADLARVERELAALTLLAEKATARIKALEQIKTDYFEIIEQIERERDQWKEMYFQASREHQTAQAMLCSALEKARHVALGLQNAVNVEREKAGLEPIRVVPDPGAPPADMAGEYRARMDQLEAGAMLQSDGKALRAKADEKFLKKDP